MRAELAGFGVGVQKLVLQEADTFTCAPILIVILIGQAGLEWSGFPRLGDTKQA